jgi:hypothetical protein
MTVYLDTGHLVKLYVDDAGSESARQLVGDATIGRQGAWCRR